MRAVSPNHEGVVDRDGVRLHYEIYGDGPETILFIPTWMFVHSRCYKAQIPEIVSVAVLDLADKGELVGVTAEEERDSSSHGVRSEEGCSEDQYNLVLPQRKKTEGDS